MSSMTESNWRKERKTCVSRQPVKAWHRERFGEESPTLDTKKIGRSRVKSKGKRGIRDKRRPRKRTCPGRTTALNGSLLMRLSCANVMLNLSATPANVSFSPNSYLREGHGEVTIRARARHAENGIWNTA